MPRSRVPQKIIVSLIQREDMLLMFPKPLVLRVNRKGREVSVRRPMLGIKLSRRSAKNLLADLVLQIANLWREYGLQRNQRLTADARLLKYRLRAMIIPLVPLRRLNSKTEYRRARKVADQLATQPELTEEQDDYFERLLDLMEEYEAKMLRMLRPRRTRSAQTAL